MSKTKTILQLGGESITLYPGKHEKAITILIAQGILLADVIECLMRGKPGLHKYGEARKYFSHKEIMGNLELADSTFLSFHRRTGRDFNAFEEADAVTYGTYMRFDAVLKSHEDALKWAKAARETVADRANPRSDYLRCIGFFIDVIKENPSVTPGDAGKAFNQTMDGLVDAEELMQQPPGT